MYLFLQTLYNHITASCVLTHLIWVITLGGGCCHLPPHPTTILLVKNLRPKEAMSLAQGHTASLRWSGELHLGIGSD